MDQHNVLWWNHRPRRRRKMNWLEKSLLILCNFPRINAFLFCLARTQSLHHHREDKHKIAPRTYYFVCDLISCEVIINPISFFAWQRRAPLLRWTNGSKELSVFDQSHRISLCFISRVDVMSGCWRYLPSRSAPLLIRPVEFDLLNALQAQW